MEGLRQEQKKTTEVYASEIISESKSREEANIELKTRLDKDCPNFEDLTRLERIKVLQEIADKAGVTIGSTQQPKYNDNRFLAEAIGLMLDAEVWGLQHNFETPTNRTFH
jgi:aromatic ring hydroxylase